MDKNIHKQLAEPWFAISHNAPACGIVRCFLSKTIMWLVGWKVTGRLPEDKKFILIGEPHTSNWDFLLMFGAAYSLRLNVSWLGKHTIFKKPFGTIMRWFGGIPIDRRASHDLVNKTAKLFEESERLALVIGPSGTRSKRDYWKSGFYWIAHTANVPILCADLDFVNKIVHVGLSFTPTGDVKKDMNQIRGFYKNIHGKHPELETDIRLKDE
ncbi:MAG: lysophospholipid acyltransferase family protein [Desulfobacteraceae bacterium]|nr:lysophospholipid acyltransferase family protein [Desulfobacteraceae bacterium]